MGTGIHNAKVEGIKEGGELPRLCNFIAESAIRFLSKLSCRWRRSYRAAHQSSPPPPSFSSREQAYASLSAIADYLMRTEPHSPAPWLVKRAVSWGGMTLSELLDELLGQGENLASIKKLLGMTKE